MSSQEAKGWVCPIDGNCETDTAVQILRYIFDTNFINAYTSGGNPALTKVATTEVGGVTPSVLPLLVNQISSIALFIALIFLCFFVLKSVLTSANDGEIVGVSRGSGSWMGTYGRPLFSVVMLAPTISGYSMIAVLVMWVVMMSNGAANRIYMQAADFNLGAGRLLQVEDNPTFNAVNNLYDPTFYGALHGYCAKSAYETLGSNPVRFNFADDKVGGHRTISFSIEDTDPSGQPGKSNVAGNLCGTFTMKYSITGSFSESDEFTLLKNVTGRDGEQLTYFGRNVTIARALSQLYAYQAGFRTAIGADKFENFRTSFDEIEKILKRDVEGGLPQSLNNALQQINSGSYALEARGWPVLQINEQTEGAVNNGEDGQAATGTSLFAPATINIKPLIQYSETYSDVMAEGIANYITEIGLNNQANASKVKEYEFSLLRNGWLGAGTARMRLASLRQSLSSTLYANPSSFTLTNLDKQEENNSKFNQHIESVAGVNDGVMKAFNSSKLKDESIMFSSSFATSTLSPAVNNSLDVSKLGDGISGATVEWIKSAERDAINSILGTKTASDDGKLDLSGSDGDILARIQYSGELFGLTSMSLNGMKIVLAGLNAKAQAAGNAGAISAVLGFLPALAAGLQAFLETVINPFLKEVTDALDNMRTMLGTIVPNLPYVLLAMAAVGWFLQIIMTMFGMPLFLIMHALPGDRFMGSQQQGWVTILALFFRPILIISAFFVALFIYEPLVVYFTNAFFAMRGQTGMSSSTGFGYGLSYITSMRDFWYMYGASLIMLTYLIFGTVQEMSDGILDWLGTNLLRNFGNLPSEKFMGGVAQSAVAASKTGRGYARSASHSYKGPTKPNKDDDPGDLSDDVNKQRAAASGEGGAARVDANSDNTFGSTTAASSARGGLSSPYGNGAALGAMAGFAASQGGSGSGSRFDSGDISSAYGDDSKQSIDSSKMDLDSGGTASGDSIKFDDEQSPSSETPAPLGSDSGTNDGFTEQEINDSAYNDMTQTPTEDEAAKLWNNLDAEQKAELASQQNPTEAQEAVIAAGENMVNEGVDKDIHASQFNQERAPIDNPTPEMSEAKALLQSMDTGEIADLAGKDGKWTNKEAAMIAAGLATGQLVKSANGGFDVKTSTGKLTNTGVLPSAANKKEANALAKRDGANPRPMAKPTNVTKSGKGTMAVGFGKTSTTPAGANEASGSNKPLSVGDKPLTAVQSAKAKQDWDSATPAQKAEMLNKVSSSPDSANAVAYGASKGEIKADKDGNISIATGPATPNTSVNPGNSGAATAPNTETASTSIPVTLSAGNKDAVAKLMSNNEPQTQNSSTTPSTSATGSANSSATASTTVANMTVSPPQGAQDYSRTATKDGSIVESWQVPTAGGGTATHTLTTKPDGGQTLMTKGIDQNGNAMNMVANYGANGQLVDRQALTTNAKGAMTSTYEKFNNSGALQQTSETTVQRNGATQTTTHQVGDNGTVTSTVEGRSSKGSFKVVETSNAQGQITSRTQTVESGGVQNKVSDVYAGNGQIQRTKSINGVAEKTAMVKQGFGASQVKTPSFNSGVASMVQESNRVMSQQAPSARTERVNGAQAVKAAYATNTTSSTPASATVASNVASQVSGTKVETSPVKTSTASNQPAQQTSGNTVNQPDVRTSTRANVADTSGVNTVAPQRTFVTDAKVDSNLSTSDAMVNVDSKSDKREKHDEDDLSDKE